MFSCTKLGPFLSWLFRLLGLLQKWLYLPACDFEPELLFQTGFLGTTITRRCDTCSAALSGTDDSFSEKSSWEEFAARPEIGSLIMNYGGATPDQSTASVVPNPDDPSNNAVLRFLVFESNIQQGLEKGRVQLDFGGSQGNQCMREIYHTVRLKFHPDMAYMKEDLTAEPGGIYFMMFGEFWNNADWTGGRNPFRVSLYLIKQNGEI